VHNDTGKNPGRTHIRGSFLLGSMPCASCLGSFAPRHQQKGVVQMMKKELYACGGDYFINGMWHPVVQNECVKINKEVYYEN
jgi:hypothetical protein